MNGLQGKKALVTGGSSGIGQAIAIRLGEEGVDVAINYVGAPEGAEETREAIEHGVQICMKEMSAAGTRLILVAADVSSDDQVAAMFEQVLGEYGRVDYLIDNAASRSPRRPTSSRSPPSTRCSPSTCAARSSAPSRRSGPGWPPARAAPSSTCPASTR